MIRRHWGFLLGILFVCAVAYAESIGTFDALKLRPGTLPAAGKDGELRVDSADSNKLKKYNETTTAWEEISGSGSGVGTNYFSDFQADTTSNVTTFDDGGTLTDGTGGTVNYMSVASETSNQLAGDASYQFVKGAADASGEGFSFDTETPDRTSTVGGETVYLTFNYATGGDYDNSTSGNQASIYIYRIGTNTLEACNTRDVLSGTFTNALPTASNGGQYQCSFTLESTDTSVRVIFWWTGTGTNSTSILVDKIKVGPDAVVTAPIVTYLGEISTTTSWDSYLSGSTVKYWREGDLLKANGKLTLNNTPVGNPTITLPNSWTIDSSKMPTGGFDNTALRNSQVTMIDNGTNTYLGGLGYNSADSLYFITGTDTGSGYTKLGGDGVTATIPFTWASGDFIHFYFEVPITQFSDSAILSTTQADHRVLRVKAINSAAQTFASGTNTLEYNSEIEDTHNAFDLSTETFTCPFTGSYDISAQVGLTADADWNGTSEVFQLNYFKNGSVYRRAGWHIPGSAQNEIVYGNKLSMDCEKGDTIVIEGNNGSGGNVSGIASGAYNYLSITGEPDFSTFSTYGPYEYQEVDITSTTTTSGVPAWTDVTGSSIVLTPGTWSLHYDVALQAVDQSSVENVQSCAIRFEDGSAGIAKTYSYNRLELNADEINGYNATGHAEVTITSTTTYNLQIYSADNSATATCAVLQSDESSAATARSSYVWARRMK